MNRFIIHTLLFSMFAVVMYCAFVALWNETLTRPFRPHAYHRLGWWGHTHSRMNEIRDTSNVDLVILGSSHAYRGFDTRIFGSRGINTINMGTGAQTPTLTKMLVNRHIEKLNPKLVIFEVTPIVLSSSSVEASLDLVANDINDIHSIKMAYEVDHPKTWNSLIVSWYKHSFGRNSDFVENVSRAKDKYISGGYVERRLEYFKSFRIAKKDIELAENEIEATREIIESLEENNIEVLLVQAPITPSKYRSHKINSSFDSLMNSMGEYYNFNELIKLDDSLHFYDGHHMNQIGVDTFNAVLLNHLNIEGRILKRH